MIALTLLNLYPASINRSNGAADSRVLHPIILDSPQDLQDSTYYIDTYPDFSSVDIHGIKPNDFFTNSLFSLEDSLTRYHKVYKIQDEIKKLQSVTPERYHYFLDKYPNKMRADIVMWYIDESYKNNYDLMQTIYNILGVSKSYRYPIFQKLNIIFDNFSHRYFWDKDIYLYDRSFYQLLYDKLIKDKWFRTDMMMYINQFEKNYRILQKKASTTKQFEFNDSSEVKNYDIKFATGYYTLPTRLDYTQVNQMLNELWVETYSSAEFDKATWNKFSYYDISMHGISSLIPQFLDYLQQDMVRTFPDLDIWGKDKLIIRGGTEYSHSDYFTSVTKKTIKSKKKWSKSETATSRQKNYLFDYRDGELADVKNSYKIDDNTIKWDFIDKIITKHQFWYSIDIQSRWHVGVAISMYSDVKSTTYNFRDKNKISIKQYWPKGHITALFSYHDHHFHILVLPTDLYGKLKWRL